MVVETGDGPALELLGLGGLEECFLTCIPFAGKESWSTQGGKPFGAPSEGKDRDCGRISYNMMWWQIVAGVEIEADGWFPRIHRPYKTKGFAPRVSYFASLP